MDRSTNGELLLDVVMVIGFLEPLAESLWEAPGRFSFLDGDPGTGLLEGDKGSATKVI